jgi:hypothetical protein
MHEGGKGQSTTKQNNKIIFTGEKHMDSEGALYFFVFFLLPLASFSSFYKRRKPRSSASFYKQTRQTKKIPQTLRLVPFVSALPLPLPLTSFPLLFDAPFLGDVLGWTVKNPSSRPCCLLFRNFASLSAPLRTRSSLNCRKIDHE